MEEFIANGVTVELILKMLMGLAVVSTLSAIPMSKGRRLNRVDYLKRMAGCLIGMMIWGEVAHEFMTFIKNSTVLTVLLMVAAGFAVGYFLSIIMRRFHDLDKTGWFVLLIFIPFVGPLIWLALFFIKGTDYRNRFH